MPRAPNPPPCLAQKDPPATTGYYHPTAYQEHERKEALQTATKVAHAIADLFAHLHATSDCARAALRAARWAWLVGFVEESSMDELMGGCAEVGVRDRAVGRSVRALARALVESGFSPRPALMPCFTTSFVLEGAGTAFVNGQYRFDGFLPLSESVDAKVPKFVHVDDATGKRLTMFRCFIQNNMAAWYVSEVSDKPGTPGDVDYYVIHQKDAPTVLPEGRFVPTGEGDKPPPTRPALQRVPLDPEDDVLRYYLPSVA
jgi:hypothetical protein